VNANSDGRSTFAIRGGFSLTELVAAMTIFSIGVMACVELYSISLRSTSDSLDYTQAVFLAQQMVEETIAEGLLTASTDSGDFGDAFPRHSYELEIENADQDGLMMIRVIVLWTSRTTEKQYELTTLYADREVLEASP
jgi:prepilin-type N-terminal cleavage/methylation domain-containing protein